MTGEQTSRSYLYMGTVSTCHLLSWFTLLNVWKMHLEDQEKMMKQRLRSVQCFKPTLRICSPILRVFEIKKLAKKNMIDLKTTTHNLSCLVVHHLDFHWLCTLWTRVLVVKLSCFYF